MVGDVLLLFPVLTPFLRLVSRNLGVFLDSLRHKSCKFEVFCLGNGFWLSNEPWDFVKSGKLAAKMESAADKDDATVRRMRAGLKQINVLSFLH